MIWLALRVVIASRKSNIGKGLTCIVFAWIAPQHLMRWWRMRNVAISAQSGEFSGTSGASLRPIFNTYGLTVGMLLDVFIGTLMWSAGERLGAALCWVGAAALAWAVLESANFWERN